MFKVVIIRYSKENNNSQEEMIEKLNIKPDAVLKFEVSGYTKDVVIQKIRDLLTGYREITVYVTELDRITRQPAHFVDLIKFLELNNYTLNIHEISTNTFIEKINTDVYQKSIKEKIETGFKESKAKSDRMKNRHIYNQNKISYALKELKKSVAYGCIVDGEIATPSVTSKILSSFGYNISPEKIKRLRQNYPPPGKHVYMIEIDNANYVCPNYEELLSNCQNPEEKTKIEQEFKDQTKVILEAFKEMGFTKEIISSMCSPENSSKQNIIWPVEAEEQETDIQEIEHQMKKVSISNSDVELTFLDDQLKKDFDEGNLSQEQYIELVGLIQTDQSKGKLIDYLYSLKTLGTIDREQYQKLTQLI